jgi:hypothetical protein
MKPIFYLVACFWLSGCQIGRSERTVWITDHAKQEQVFDGCLDRAASARKGSSYATHDAEKWDDVVSECGHQAEVIATKEVTLPAKDQR